MDRITGTLERDMPHEFRGEYASCVICQGPTHSDLHEEWARVERASRQTAKRDYQDVPRMHG